MSESSAVVKSPRSTTTEKSVPQVMIPLWVCLVLLAVIIVMAMYYYYTQYQVKSMLERNVMPPQAELTPSPYVKDAKSDSEAQTLIVGDGVPKVILLHAQWCGHCRNMMSSYVSAAASSDKTVKWHRVDASIAPSLVRRDDVKGFPTIFGVMASGQMKLHVGGRDETSLLNFAKSLISTTVTEVTEQKTEVVAEAEVPAVTDDQQETEKENSNDNENEKKEELN